MYSIVMHKEKSVCIAKAEHSLVFQWIDGTTDIYVYENERLLKTAVEDFHMYESPTEASGRIVWCSNRRILERVRGNVDH